MNLSSLGLVELNQKEMVLIEGGGFMSWFLGIIASVLAADAVAVAFPDN